MFMHYFTYILHSVQCYAVAIHKISRIAFSDASLKTVDCDFSNMFNFGSASVFFYCQRIYRIAFPTEKGRTYADALET